MSREWAIIVDNVIGNVIISDEEFLANHEDWSKFERIDITDLNPKPAVTWKLEGNKFIKPAHVLPENTDHILDDEHLEVEVK